MKRYRIRSALNALCVLALTVLAGCSTSGGGGCSSGSYSGGGTTPQPIGLQLYGTANVHVGDEVRVNARYADSEGKQVSGFWQQWRYSINHDGLGDIEDVGLLNPDGTAYARYRALTAGTFTVVWTVWLPNEPPVNIEMTHATFTVTVQ